MSGALPTYAAVRGELARRAFPHWCKRRFRILPKGKPERFLDIAARAAQRELYDLEERMLRERGRVRIYVLKGRQGGISTFEQARSLHTAMHVYGARCLTLADDGGNAAKVYAVTRYAVERFAEGEIPDLGDKRANELVFPNMASHFYTGTAGSSTIGRSTTLRRLHGSEFATWPNPMTTLNTVSPALEYGGTSIILETTASLFDSEGHTFWREARESRNGYWTLFIPWWKCDPEEYAVALEEPDELGALAGDERELVDRQGLTLAQIKWRRWKIRDMGGRSEFFQAYPEDDESCWLAAGGMYYPAETLRLLLQRTPEPMDVAMGGELEFYGRGVPAGERVIIGADTAEGTGGDGSTFAARSFPSWRKLVRFRSETITPKEFAGLLNRTGRALAGAMGPALLVVEKNMHGITVLRHLRDDHKYPVGSIYHRAPLDQVIAEGKDRIGWHTSEQSKPIMLSAGRELLDAALEGYADAPCAAALKQALAIRRNEQGKFVLTGRDDMVAEMLAWIGRSAPIPSSGTFEWARRQATQRAAAAAQTNGNAEG